MNISSFKAVILDMDGVIVDSEHQWKQIERPFFQEIVPGWTEEDFERIVGLGVMDLYCLLVKEYRMAMPQDRFLQRCSDVAEEVYCRRVCLAPGIEHFLSELEKQDLPVALASSSSRPWIKMVLDRFELHSRFKATVSVDDVGGEGKPAPAIYYRARAMLGVCAENCLAVEDSFYGVLAAKRADISCVVGFRNGGNAEQDLSLADFEVSGFGELHERLWGGAKKPGVHAKKTAKNMTTP